MKRFFSLLFVLIAIFTFTSCSTVSNCATDTVVSVSGTGTINLEADLVKFSISVDENDSTTALAQQKTNKKMSQILTILRSFKIEDKDISTTSLNFGSRHEWVGNNYVKVGESVSQSVYVTMRDISLFSSLADELGKQITDFSFNNVSFDSSKKSDALVKARELAYADALKKAEQYASCSNLKVKEPITISELSSSSNSYKYANTGLYMVAESAVLDSSYGTEAPSGLLSVTVNVDVSFKLDD